MKSLVSIYQIRQDKNDIFESLQRHAITRKQYLNRINFLRSQAKMIRLLEGADMYTPEEIEKMIDKLQKDLFTASAKWEAYKKRGDLLNMTIEQRRQKFQQEFAILEKEHNINVLSSLIIRTA